MNAILHQMKFVALHNGYPGQEVLLTYRKNGFRLFANNYAALMHPEAGGELLSAEAALLCPIIDELARVPDGGCVTYLDPNAVRASALPCGYCQPDAPENRTPWDDDYHQPECPFCAGTGREIQTRGGLIMVDGMEYDAGWLNLLHATLPNVRIIKNARITVNRKCVPFVFRFAEHGIGALMNRLKWGHP